MSDELSKIIEKIRVPLESLIQVEIPNGQISIRFCTQDGVITNQETVVNKYLRNKNKVKLA